MPDAWEPDVIRLSLPADGDLRGVVEVAAGVLARRLRFADDAIAAARIAAGAAFDEVARAAGDGDVEVEAHIMEAQIVLHLEASGSSRSVTIPPGSPTPG
jgi:hypothetical protein